MKSTKQVEMFETIKALAGANGFEPVKVVVKAAIGDFKKGDELTVVLPHNKEDRAAKNVRVVSCNKERMRGYWVNADYLAVWKKAA